MNNKKRATFYSKMLGYRFLKSLARTNELLELNHRRKNLLELINSQKNDIILLFSNIISYRMKDVPYKFKQHTNFQYLTNVNLPESCLLIKCNNQSPVLYTNIHDKNKEIWDGPTPLTNLHNLGYSTIQPIQNLSSDVKKLTSKFSNIWISNIDQFIYFRDIPSYINEIKEFFYENKHQIKLLDGYIQELKKIKSPYEIDLMRKSCSIASKALNLTMQNCQTNLAENLIETYFELESKRLGASGNAYIPVVAGGSRACTIHYIDNDKTFSPKSDLPLLLMDAGCEYENYCSDISRTWPLSGKFSTAESELYDALLDVQQKCINACIADEKESLDSLLSKMYGLMVQNFSEIKLIPPSLTKLEKLKLVHDLCPHHVGHHLGMDIHDCHLIDRSEPLEPGMIITIEPGVYLRPDDNRIPKEFRGKGMRIEDDILITEGKPENLTQTCIKERVALEKHIKQTILP